MECGFVASGRREKGSSRGIQNASFLSRSEVRSNCKQVTMQLISPGWRLTPTFSQDTLFRAKSTERRTGKAVRSV